MLRLSVIVFIVLIGLFLQVDVMLARPDWKITQKLIWLFLWNSTLTLVVFGIAI